MANSPRSTVAVHVYDLSSGMAKAMSMVCSVHHATLRISPAVHCVNSLPTVAAHFTSGSLREFTSHRRRHSSANRLTSSLTRVWSCSGLARWVLGLSTSMVVASAPLRPAKR